MVQNVRPKNMSLNWGDSCATGWGKRRGCLRSPHCRRIRRIVRGVPHSHRTLCWWSRALQCPQYRRKCYETAEGDYRVHDDCQCVDDSVHGLVLVGWVFVASCTMVQDTSGGTGGNLLPIRNVVGSPLQSGGGYPPTTTCIGPYPGRIP